MRAPSNERACWLVRYVIPHERAIRSWLRRRTHALEIDDVIQEMYARLASLEDVAGIRHPRQYAMQAAISIAFSQARHARIVPMLSLEDFEGSWLASPEPSPERALNSQEELRDLEKALQTLPYLCRTVFLLRRVEGLSQKDVADRLCISVKTVEKHMSKSVQFLIRAYGRGNGAIAQMPHHAVKNVSAASVIAS